MSSWDDICINPHEAEIESGRKEGQIAGLQAGFNDGFALGRTKGIEFGMELGFIRGFLNTVEAKPLLNERLEKKIEELRQAIDDFPSLDAIKKTDKEDEETYMYRREDDSEAVVVSGSLDILGSMQRIRAKFKVLTVQLKAPQFSLKHVMDDANRTESDGETPIIRRKNADDSQGLSSEWWGSTLNNGESPAYADCFIILVETSAPAAMAKTVATTKVSGPYTESLATFFVFPPFGLRPSSISWSFSYS